MVSSDFSGMVNAPGIKNPVPVRPSGTGKTNHQGQRREAWRLMGQESKSARVNIPRAADSIFAA